MFNVAAPYWLDVDQFERALDTVESEDQLDPQERWIALDQLRDGVELYRGDFLAGFYDDWVTFEQERLRERYLERARHCSSTCSRGPATTSRRSRTRGA